MYMMYGYGYGPEFAFMHFFNWIFWIVLIIVAIKVLRHRPWRGEWLDHDRALDILKERYAKGEINKEEFEAKKKDLMAK